MPADLQRTRELFLHAVGKLPPEQWDGFVAETCKGDAELERQVRHLLQVHREAGSFLETPAVPPVIEELADRAFDRATQAEPAGGDGEDVSLEFLTPSEKPASLGRLGHYEVQEVIGRGGMGIVLRALDVELHRVVAIKVMAQQLATNAAARKRFKREAQAVAAVIHDHVVTLHAVEEANGLPYLVMQYIAGLSLQQRLDRDGPLELREILRIGMQTASGLAAAHAQGLIHRDIKPANILLENGVERVKITDFGLARAAADANLTQSGMVAGTPQYMSPEQAEGKAIDPRTDLFSLGSVLYAMCTGRAPFRASGTMAVLKRVCEEIPTPVRQTNPEIPEWLVEIIAKLHAKDPAQRYQSAVEVAELLGQHLAQVQHPSVVGQVANVPPEPKVGSRPSTRRRLAIAAAVLVCLVGGLSLTDAGGVTNLRATVIRIFTPEGILVVETDDPAVKVTVEGDGDLVITGAGPQEVRLKAGSYRLKATKDGKPVKLDRDLVAISRGDRQIVRVRLEDGPAATVVPKTKNGAFVLLAAGKERKFDTLAEAVQGASDGDTIEICGNGPFVSQPIKVTRALCIRAGAGCRPVIQLSPEAIAEGADDLLETLAPLIVEGLELQRVPQAPDKHVGKTIILARAPLHVANCRLLISPPARATVKSPAQPSGGLGPPIISDATICELRNCEIIGPTTSGVASYHTPHLGLNLDNCCACLATGIDLNYLQPGTQESTVRLTRNTIVAQTQFVLFRVYPKNLTNLWTPNLLTKAIRCETEGNILDARSRALLFSQAPPGKILPPAEAEASLPQVFTWHGARNLYAVGGPFLGLHIAPGEYPAPVKPIRSVAEWGKYWGAVEAGSIEGLARYQGGNLLARLKSAPEKLTAEDFRLRPDSAGYKAGKDGKDLGADVHFVGPGPAYERWKKTPAYQQWLKDTGQLRAEAPKAERGAFVRLGGKGVAERKFDTLADAVLAASDGDTIEIRGNGPFVSQHIKVTRALCIRAGAGFRPVIQLSPEAIAEGANLLETLAPLIVEGLELQRVPQAPNKHVGKAIIRARAPLHVANCRLLSKQNWGPPIFNLGPNCELRNCEIIGGPGQQGISWGYSPHARLNLDNCCVSCWIGITLQYLPQNRGADNSQACTVRMTRNTFVGNEIFMLTVHPGRVPNLWTKDLPTKLTRCETEGNIFDARLGVALFSQAPPGKILSPQESEESLPQVLTWHGTRNLYAVGGPFLRFYITTGEYPAPANPIKSVAEWGKYWGAAEAASIEGRACYRGGDLLARLTAAPEKLTAEAFRLRPDSAGYKAGKDKKDLGADVDLVGPGAAYEQWKTTPAYQQWLKETGQVKK